MLENAADSHTSAARFVGTLLTCKTRCPKKSTTAELPKLLHELFTFTTDENHNFQIFSVRHSDMKSPMPEKLTFMWRSKQLEKMKNVFLLTETNLINANKLTRSFAKRKHADFENLHQRTTNKAEAKNQSQSDLTNRQLD